MANALHTKYSQVVPELRATQKDIELNLLDLQPAVENVAIELARTGPKLTTRLLTDYQ